jgi:GntR family transcriptional repressor for pyruvate dehydrogenase complex
MMASRPDRGRHGTPSASETVAESIRAWIASLELEPGDRLGREEDLARQFGVSRPTLREALRLLSSAHLVRASKGPGGGIFVDATAEEGLGHSVAQSVAGMLSAETIEIGELLETRMLLEVPLAGLAAARATDADIGALRALLTAANRNGSDAELTTEFDGPFHARLAQIAGNRLASAFMRWVVEVLQPPLHALIEPAIVSSVARDQHEDIVRAIERGEPAAAERAMHEHLVYLKDLVNAVEGAQLGESDADQ